MTLTTRTHSLRPALLLGALAVVAAGCGSTSGNRSAAPGPSAAPSSTPAAARSGAVVMVRTVGALGPVLVDSNGRTLYLFLKDTTGKSTCSGTCAQVWPALTSAGTPTAGPGASAALLGTTPNTHQVTYAGHPLYLYVSDTQPGQATGQGLDQFGAEWYALSSHGDKVEGSGSTDGSAHY